MKKVAGIIFIAVAAVLLSSSMKPLVDEVPSITKVETPIQKFVDELPRITLITPSIKTFVDELPRIT